MHTYTAADYSVPDMILAFTEMHTTDCATVNITRDGIFEAQEDFTVTLSGQDGVNVVQSTATVTITDSDSMYI